MEKGTVYVRIKKIDGRYFAVLREERGIRLVWPMGAPYGFDTEYQCLTETRKALRNLLDIIFDTHLY